MLDSKERTHLEVMESSNELVFLEGLDIASLGGATPTEVEAAAGTPSVAPSEDELITEGVYQPLEGGGLTVIFCEGQAISLTRTVSVALPTVNALLAQEGIQAAVTNLDLVEEAEGHQLWVHQSQPTGNQPESTLERVMVLRDEYGWNQIELDFAAIC